MTTKAGVGTSHHHNPNVAGREAAGQALKKAGIDKPDFVFMFASISYDQHSLLRAVRETTGSAPLTGCSAEGTIDGDEADESNYSVLITAISSDELRWHNGLATGLRADSRAVGQQVAQELLSHLSNDTIGLFVFPDGLIDYLDNFFAGLVLRRFRQSVGPDVPWAGFYTIGEIGSVEEHNDRHLYTSVVLALS
jgi:hypothetical protein